MFLGLWVLHVLLRARWSVSVPPEPLRRKGRSEQPFTAEPSRLPGPESQPPPHLPGWAVSQAPGASVWMGFGAHKVSVGPDLCLERTKQFRKVCPQGPPIGDFSPGATGEWARPTCLPHKMSPAPPRRAHAHTSTVPRAGAYDIITAIH